MGKGGTGVVTGMGSMTDIDVKLSLFELTVLQKRLQGAMFGGGDPRYDIPKLLGLYADMNAGKNVRGVVMYGEADC